MERERTKPATGTVVRTKSGLWQAIVTLPNGKRKRMSAFPEGTTEDQARDMARQLSESTRKTFSGAPNSHWSRDPRGHRFGQYVVMAELPEVNGKRRVAARCDCGAINEVYLSELTRSNGTRQCRTCVRNAKAGDSLLGKRVAALEARFNKLESLLEQMVSP